MTTTLPSEHWPMTIQTYPVEPVPPESANAGFKDWFLQVFKRPAFTIEAGLGENPLPTSQLPEITRALSAIFTAAMQW